MARKAKYVAENGTQGNLDRADGTASRLGEVQAHELREVCRIDWKQFDKATRALFRERIQYAVTVLLDVKAQNDRNKTQSCSDS
ncbi:MAG TPA: hypothetical protein PLB73_14665 [Leptospiraceae bacterium]|nr:hypothetical protein [Leptospiraceae bacterium]